MSGSLGIEVNPIFPIDPLSGTYNANGLAATLPGAVLLSFPNVAAPNGIQTGIVSGVATTIGTITCANVNASASAILYLRIACNSAGHVYDSTRVAQYNLAIGRIAGSALVGTLSSVIGAAIATPGTDTLTFTLALATVAGAVTATNTIAIQITVTESGGFTSEVQMDYMLLNGAVFGPSIT